ncbi:MAG TPA: sulfur transferase domain-containing protein [Methylomirabilota bacterium]|jgi:uncharacterized protein (TIGR01244 family)|nr:sulfur transferase domain-containing protein [Methylomirabilota bacterium]
MWQAVNDWLAIAGTLVWEDITALARRGYRTFIDLRGEHEPVAGGLTPRQVERCVIACGLSYRQIPVLLTRLDDATVDAVRHTLREVEKPILLHCASGRRAGALALMHLGCEEGATVEHCLTRARVMGLDFDDLSPLRDFFVSYLTRYSGAYRADVTDNKNSAKSMATIAPKRGGQE